MVFSVYAKYWPADRQAKVLDAINAELLARGVSADSVAVIQLDKPSRLEVTIVNPTKPVALDHLTVKDAVDRLATRG